MEKRFCRRLMFGGDNSVQLMEMIICRLTNRIPLPVISEILGHSSTETTMTYLRVDIDQLRNCALEVTTYEN